MIWASSGKDTIYGGGGWDTYDFSTVTASISMDITTQTHTGFAAGNLIYQVEGFKAGSGHDTLRGAGGTDRIHAGGGNDLLIATLGADTLIGGSGVDKVTYEKLTSGVVADLMNEAANSGGAAGHRYDMIESLTGSAYGDTLRGSELGNDLQGGAGDDRLEGRDAGDALGGGEGADTLDGGIGSDTMTGGAGDDAYWVNDAGDVLIEVSSGGTDRVMTSISIDFLNGNGAYANMEHILLWGSAGLFAAGNASNNSLIGNTGNNLLIGREGGDALTGGAGADMFQFRKGFDHDTIVDFQDNVDTIRILDFGLTTFAQAKAYSIQSGADVVFNFGAGDGITIRNTAINTLGDDLVFG